MKANIPILRFPGFNGDWETKKLGEFIEEIAMGPFGSNLKVEMFTTEGVPIIKGGNLLGHTVTGPYSFVSEAKANTLGKSIALPGDFVLTHRGTLGQISVVPENQYTRYVTSQSQLRFRTNRSLLANEWLSQYFNTKLGKNRMLVDAGQVGVPAISFPTASIKKVCLVLPGIVEQEKIADFLTTVDKKIAVHAGKVELLKQYKKGVMQAIFTQKLRFKDENGNSYPEWEKKAVHDIAYSETSPLAANNITERSGNYKVYGASGVLQTLDTYHYEDEYIAIVKDGAGAGRIIYCDPKSSVLGTLIVVQPKDGICKRFLFYTLSLIDFKKYIVGSTIPHVYFKQYSQTKFKVPLYQEQLKIADFLMTLENKIDSEECRLEQTKRFKKYLLREMFV